MRKGKMILLFDRYYKKLRDPVFTTVRSASVENKVKYQDLVGKVLLIQVTEDGKAYNFWARLLQIFVIDRDKLSEDFVKYDTEGIYEIKGSAVIVLLFKKLNQGEV